MNFLRNLFRKKVRLSQVEGRLKTIEQLETYYLAELAEDFLDGTEFDNLILDFFDGLRKQVKEEV